MQLPDDVEEDHDSADVASYWMPGDGCLLQISCFRRDTGPQVSASERISERMKKGGSWKPFDLPHRIEGCDASATRTVDDSGISWVHAYLAWPWLSIHVTVSQLGDLVRLRVGLGGCYDHSPRRHVIKAEASMSAIACYRHVCVPYSLQVPLGK